MHSDHDSQNRDMTLAEFEEKYQKALDQSKPTVK
jgi:hypothetical protein